MVGVLREPAGDGPHPVVIMIPGLDSAKEESRSTEELFLDRGLATFSVDGPGQGEAEYDLAIRPDWEVPGAAIIDRLSAEPALDGQPDRGLGREPRRVLRAPGGQRGRAGPGLRGPGRAVQLRRPVGQPAHPHPGGVPGQVQVGGHGRRAGCGHAAQPRRAGRADPLPAAGGHGQAGPAHPVDPGGPVAEEVYGPPSCYCSRRATTAAPIWHPSTVT